LKQEEIEAIKGIIKGREISSRCHKEVGHVKKNIW
jgi:hypothetical protein